MDKLFFAENSSLKEIGSHAFARCKKLKEEFPAAKDEEPQKLDLPDSLERIGDYAFYATGLWRVSDLIVVLDNWIVGVRFPKIYGPQGGGIAFPSEIVGVCDYAFYNAIGYESIVMNEGLKYIGKGAFYNAAALKTVNVPSTVKTLGDYAFYGCTALESVTVASGVETIGRSAFYNCAALTSVNLPYTVKSIGDHAFYNCLSLASAGLGGAKSVGNCAFAGCTALESVKIPDTVTTIGRHAFNGCTALKTVSIGRNLEKISEYAFANCTALEKITVPASVKEIGDRAFFRATALTEAELADGVEIIGNYAFYGCTALENVRFSMTLKSIGNYAFKGDSALKSAAFGASLERVGKLAFYGCNELTFYLGADSEGEGFDELWNASYRPVIYGATIADGAVTGFNGRAENIINDKNINGVSAPYRKGFVFLGWSYAEGGEAEIPADKLKENADGRELFAVYQEKFTQGSESND